MLLQFRAESTVTVCPVASKDAASKTQALSEVSGANPHSLPPLVVHQQSVSLVLPLHPLAASTQ